MTHEDERDYEEYEGRKVFMPAYGTKTGYGVVRGCDRHIGITITELDDPKDIIYCLVGPCAPGSTADTAEKIATNFKRFDKILSFIDEGAFPPISRLERVLWAFNQSDKISCPFSA